MTNNPAPMTNDALCSVKQYKKYTPQTTHRHREHRTVLIVTPLDHLHRALAELDDGAHDRQAADGRRRHDGRTGVPTLRSRAKHEEGVRQRQQREADQAEQEGVRRTPDRGGAAEEGGGAFGRQRHCFFVFVVRSLQSGRVVALVVVVRSRNNIIREESNKVRGFIVTIPTIK